MEALSELYKKLEKLKDNRSMYWREFNLAGTAKVEAEIKALEKRIEDTSGIEKTTLHELLKGQPEELVDRFETYSILLVALIDLADGIIMDENAMLKKITKDDVELHAGKIVRQIKKLTHEFIVMSDGNCNEATAADYGEFSDHIKPLLIKKAQEHLAWSKMKNGNVRYALE